MTKIYLVATDQTLTVRQKPKVASGNKNTVYVNVEFSSHWDGFGKSAVFFRDEKGAKPIEKVLTAGECIVPPEVLVDSGIIFIGIRGVDSNGEVKVSALIKYKIVDGAPEGEGTSVEPTASVYQQLLTAYGKTDAAITKETFDRKTALATEMAERKTADAVEKTERQAEIAVERARIDSFVALEDGSTTGDAELQDVRIGNDGEVYNSAGTAIRQQNQRLNNLSSCLSLYDLNIVRDYMGLNDLCGINSLVGNVNDSTKTWQYVYKTIKLPVGIYTVVIKDMSLSSVGSFSIKANTTAVKYLDETTEPGIYVFEVYDDGTYYDENSVTLLMQISTATAVSVGTYYVSGISIFEGDITSKNVLPSNLLGTDRKLDKVIGKNLFNKNTVTKGVFIRGTGEEFINEYSSSFYASDYIRALPNTTYALTDYNIGGAYIAFYDESCNCIGGISGTSGDGEKLVDLQGIFTTPEGCAYIRISGNIENIDTNQLEIGDTITEYDEYTEYAQSYENSKRIAAIESKLASYLMPETVLIDTLNNGDSISIESPNSKNHNTIGFNAKITSFDKVVISHGKTKPYCSAYIVVDASNVYVYAYPGSETLIGTYSHGINISDFIVLNIHVSGGFTATLTLVSSSGAFTQEITWNGSNGNIVVESNGSVLTNCALTYYINGLKKDIWMFGDSYFDYWPQTLIDLGYNDFYLDGYSGRSSLFALASLTKCLAYCKPKKIVWFMGMNDADNGKVNNSWLNIYNMLVKICSDNNIELILSTVPNVPTRDHTYKNEIVRNSGYRYIDICSAVGADDSTSWHDELLGGDGVHPTSTKGAAVIANYVINHIPEIL